MNITDTYTIENNLRVYDSKRVYQYLQFLGNRKYGAHFKLSPADKPILYKLLIYAIQDEKNCEAEGIDLKKGILLTGPVGCGKTALMTLLPNFMDDEYKYLIKTTRDIVLDFNREGYQLINMLGKSPKNYFFDDLGIELPGKYFGNECNAVAEVMLHRYDNFVHSGTITHATTNLNAQELEDRYGNRVRSRLREMFNLIAFDRSTPDKRR